MLTIQSLLVLAVAVATPAFAYPSISDADVDPASLAAITELTGVDATTLHPLVRREWPIKEKEWLCVNNDISEDSKGGKKGESSKGDKKGGKGGGKNDGGKGEDNWITVPFDPRAAECMVHQAPLALGGTKTNYPHQFWVCSLFVPPISVPFFPTRNTQD